MKKMMILIAVMAMATLATQADNLAPVTTTVAAMDTEAPAPIEGDTNGTEEVVPEGK
jgi:HAMP domain-containing protein